MKKSLVPLSFVICFLLCTGVRAFAGDYALVEAALWPGVQICDSKTSVTGLRFGLYSKNLDVYGVDLALIGETTENFAGIGVGLIQGAKYHYGLSVGGIVSGKKEMCGFAVGLLTIAKVQKGLFAGIFSGGEDVYGISVAGYGLAYHLYGIQTGISNKVFKNGTGLQLGVVNRCARYEYLLQLGCFNLSDYAMTPMTGVLLNYSYFKATGGQYSLAINYAYVTPVQISGLLNGTDDAGCQLTLGMNVARKTGLQFAGLVNYTGDSTEHANNANDGVNSTCQIAGGVNVTKQSVFQFAGLYNGSDRSHVQLSPGLNYSGNDIIEGHQVAVLANYARHVTSQTGVANIASAATFQVGGLNFSARIDGAQAGLLNYGRYSGTQIGAINLAKFQRGNAYGLINCSSTFDGLAVGAVNYTGRLIGWQIGLININRHGNWPVMPFVNWDNTKKEIETDDDRAY